MHEIYSFVRSNHRLKSVITLPGDKALVITLCLVAPLNC